MRGGLSRWLGERRCMIQWFRSGVFSRLLQSICPNPASLDFTRPFSYYPPCTITGRVARVVESGGLEIRCTGLLYRGFESLTLRTRWLQRLRRGDRVADGERLESVCTLTGYRGFESPSLRSAPPALRSGPCARGRRRTPSGPEGSSGTWMTAVPQIAWASWRGFFAASAVHPGGPPDELRGYRYTPQTPHI